ncbi:hypothetical protein LUZ60_006692 [Juncus effusus]|nr:hypothetical protein LUZ60_006692 [Juncus effusus]
MRELEGRIRCSYSEEIRMSSPDLAEMMMLDGCFILHLVLKETENVDMNDSNEDWTQVLGRCWIWNLVRYDLLLLENQIPFFVVRELYSIFKSAKERTADILMFENKWKQRVNLEITEEQANDIIELERGQERGNDIVNGVQNEYILVKGSLKLFSTLHPCKTNTYFTFKADQVHHLLHLIYLSILESLEPLPATPPVKEMPNWVPSAKELQETGVQFKKKQDAKSFLDIKFTKGVIEIPPLQIYDYSDSLFRNLIAFEQCYPDTKWHVTAYAAFMDCLINTPDDMRLLHLAGVVTNRMTVDQNAANFFSSLCSHAHYSNEWNYLRNVLIGGYPRSASD